MRRITVSEARKNLSKVLRMAEEQEIVITRHGKPYSPGALSGFSKQLVAFGQEVTVGLEAFRVGDQDAQAFEALQAVLKHWAILLTEDVLADVDDDVLLGAGRGANPAVVWQ